MVYHVLIFSVAGVLIAMKVLYCDVIYAYIIYIYYFTDAPILAKSNDVKDQIDVECLKLSHTISSQLLGSLKPAESKTAGYKKYLTSWNKMTSKTSLSPLDYEVKATMAEKYVTLLLQDSFGKPDNTTNASFYKIATGGQQSGTVAGRFRLNVKHDNLTLSCCGRCSGDIHVV